MKEGTMREFTLILALLAAIALLLWR